MTLRLLIVLGGLVLLVCIVAVVVGIVMLVTYLNKSNQDTTHY